jgi:hypothetical protein
MEEKDKKIVVSNEFVDIYRNFNVGNQVDKMKALTKRELYLLLTLCLDKHSDENPTVSSNFSEFKDQCLEIFDIQDEKSTENQTLLNLIEESGDQYIETDNIVDSKGDRLPDPYTKDEIRDIRIGIIENK